jgi:hypothetical protein
MRLRRGSQTAGPTAAHNSRYGPQNTATITPAQRDAVYQQIHDRLSVAGNLSLLVEQNDLGAARRLAREVGRRPTAPLRGSRLGRSKRRWACGAGAARRTAAADLCSSSREGNRTAPGKFTERRPGPNVVRACLDRDRGLRPSAGRGRQQLNQKTVKARRRWLSVVARAARPSRSNIKCLCIASDNRSLFLAFRLTG